MLRALTRGSIALTDTALIDTGVIYCGDNLDQLRKLPDGYVDLIYISADTFQERVRVRPSPILISDLKCKAEGVDNSAQVNQETRPFFIPIILGTARQGRQSEHVAQFVFAEVKKRQGIETELIDIRNLPLKLDDAGEQMKDPVFSSTVQRADALVLVVPEYNHGYPGLLKHALDMNLKEYIHKAVGICGVSAGPFGGVRVIENLLPVMRELGLVTIFEDVNFGSVRKLFDESGKLLDENYIRRVDKFLQELIWMARLLRYGRETFPST